MSYQDTITYLESFINYEKKARYPYKESFKLERIAGFLAGIGDPHRGLRCIHVAGTKGKGSVCALAASMLRHMGYRVGLYTSPHLVDVRERIRVLLPPVSAGSSARRSQSGDFEGMIPAEELTRLTARVRPEIAAYDRRSAYGPLSFFEVYTALAFLYFKDQAVDYAVLETGLGGRLDATNVVKPHIVGITSISFDHMNKLGNTLEGIAMEKAGIIKSKTPTGLVISAPQEDVVAAVLRSRCEEQQARLYEVGRDILCEAVSASRREQVFNISGVFGSYEHMRLPLLGRHQLINAAVAAGLVAGSVDDPCVSEKRNAMKRGLRASRWPGRFEVTGGHPAVILDGAHNEASAQALAQTLREFIPGRDIILVLGISRDKDAANICKHLVPLARQCIVTRADNPRARLTSDIAARIREQGMPMQVIEAQRVATALDIAQECAGPGDTIVVAGSLFIVGEARQILAGTGPSGAHEIS